MRKEEFSRMVKELRHLDAMHDYVTIVGSRPEVQEELVKAYNQNKQNNQNNRKFPSHASSRPTRMTADECRDFVLYVARTQDDPLGMVEGDWIPLPPQPKHFTNVRNTTLVAKFITSGNREVLRALGLRIARTSL
jgi:hypothetical protein